MAKLEHFDDQERKRNRNVEQNGQLEKIKGQIKEETKKETKEEERTNQTKGKSKEINGM